MDVPGLLLDSIDLTEKVIAYVKDVKNAPRERELLYCELSGTNALLKLVKDHITTSSISCQSEDLIRQPVELFNAIWIQWEPKLELRQGFGKVVSQLRWPRDKINAKEALEVVGRLKQHLILVLQDDVRQLGISIKDDIFFLRQILGLVREDLNLLSKAEHDRKTKAILEWLSPLSSRNTQATMKEKPMPGTGRWFIESDQVQNWLAAPGHTLHCSGIPGSGKTYLAALVIEHLKTVIGTNACLAFAYCSYEQRVKFRPEDILGSLLEQLIESTLPLSDEISQSFIDHGEGESPLTWNEVRNLLLTVSRDIDRIFIVIDALDEFEGLGNPQDLLDALSELHQAGNMNLMIFSRTNQNFDFRGKSWSRLDVEASIEDLQRYLNDYVIPKMEQGFMHHNSDLHKSIVDNVSKSARGMFLLPSLLMDPLRECFSAKDVKDLVENLTTRGDILAKIYHRTMTGIKARTNSAKVLRLLTWVTFATRPLTQQQVAYALAVRPNDTRLDEESCPDVRLMVRYAGGLLKMDESSGVIRFVHLTAQEYLKNNLSRSSGELDMAKTCLSYLSMDKFRGSSGGGDKTSVSTDPFLEYAATSWGDHLRSHAPGLAQGANGTALSSLGNETMSQVDTFLCLEDRLSDIFVINEQFYRGQWIIQSAIRGIRLPEDDRIEPRELRHEKGFVTGLHIATLFDLRSFVSDMLASGIEADFHHIGFPQTALQWAARLDRVCIAKLLISAGADTNDLSTSWPCLHQAVGAGFLEKGMVELLLDNGAKIDAKSSAAQQRTALGRACFHGRADMALLLLKRGANPLILDKAGDTAMGAAMLGSMDADIVRGLLEAAAQLCEQDRHLILSLPDRAEYGVRPLHRAACANHSRIATMMVNFVSQQLSDTSVLDLTNKHNKTALMDAAERTFPSTVQILVDAGANLHIRSHNGWNCLEWAVFGGERSLDRSRVIQILLHASEELIHGPLESKVLQEIRDDCP